MRLNSLCTWPRREYHRTKLLTDHPNDVYGVDDQMTMPFGW